MSPFSIYIFKGSIFQPAILVFSGKSSPWCFFPVSLLSPPPHSGENWSRKEGLDLHGLPLDHQLTSLEGSNAQRWLVPWFTWKNQPLEGNGDSELGNHPFFRCKMLNFRGGIQRSTVVRTWKIGFCGAFVWQTKKREKWNVVTWTQTYHCKDEKTSLASLFLFLSGYCGVCSVCAIP